MNISVSNRIESLDITRGLVMVIMALDHVRDYFYYGAFFTDPTNLETTTPALFFTRFVTHFCAPVFIFLAGTSAFLYGQNKTKKELSWFLFSRGVWLIFLELALNNLIWTFDVTYSAPNIQVIWAIGVSFVILSLLIYLPLRILFGFSLIVVLAHNSLDGIVMQGTGWQSILWYLLHQQQFTQIAGQSLFINYSIIPWFAVMALGYTFGSLYSGDSDSSDRRGLLIKLGVACLVMFFILRGVNIYGDPSPWSQQKDFTYTILSFFNVSKYPPSLSFLLVTLGPMFLFLAFVEKIKNRSTDFMLVFGRVPLFYYFLHVLVIHALAIAIWVALGNNGQDLIMNVQTFRSGVLTSYGYSLPVTYLVWVAVIALLYFPCKKYMHYKANNKHRTWLSYF